MTFVKLSVAALLAAGTLDAQPTGDSIATPVQGGIYDRPFIGSAGRTAIGGYIEGNTNFAREDGVGEGFSMELRRFNIFLFTSISSRIRFISELEFEHGTEEIALETALIDLQVNPSFVMRAGILLVPIGAFNVNHDSPRWSFIDRPLVSTEIIPATLSEVGFGVHGRLRPRGFSLTYDAYVTNGLGDGVILNAEGRTSLAAGKSEEQFGEDNNGSPALSGRFALQHQRLGEVGLSWYGGVYNSYKAEGIVVDVPRRVDLFALDLSTELGPVELRGEAALARVEMPSFLREVFGTSQFGWHLDASLPVFRPRIRSLPDAALHADLRIEAIDLNRGTFASTGANIGAETTAVVLGASFRPVSGTILKFNYRRARMRDLLDNAPTRLGVIQVGFATYF